jgi:hypothetical protein
MVALKTVVVQIIAVHSVTLIGDRATADLSGKIFPERSRRKFINKFIEQLEDRQFCQKISSLLPH